jgi:hypothetical protein
MELGLFIFSLFNSCDKSLAWQYTPVIPALRKLRQEDLQLEINLVTWQDPVLKTTRKKNQELGAMAPTCIHSYSGSRDQEDQGPRAGGACLWSQLLRRHE